MAIHNRYTSIASLLALLFVMLVGHPSNAADIVLRPTASARGNLVLLGDIATIESTDAVRARRLAAVPLMPKPSAARPQFLSRRQVEEMLTAQGIDLSDHVVRGAAQVRLGQFARRVQSVSKVSAQRTFKQHVSVSMLNSAKRKSQQAIAEYLQTYASPNEPWDVQVNLTNEQLRQVAIANSPITVRGGKAPWLGQQTFELQFTTREGPVRIQTFAAVTLPEPVVVAIRPIVRGAYITANDVELRRVAKSQGFASRVKPLHRLKSVIGKEATRMIQEGKPVYLSHVRSPVVVQRGDAVTVFARAAGISVRTFGKAGQSGSVGDLIQVESIETRERIMARVTGWKEVEVFAGATASADYGKDRHVAEHRPTRRELPPVRTHRRSNVAPNRIEKQTPKEPREFVATRPVREATRQKSETPQKTNNGLPFRSPSSIRQ